VKGAGFRVATLLPYPLVKEDLGQRFCVPAFGLVCLFQAIGIIGSEWDRLKRVIAVALPSEPVVPLWGFLNYS